MGGEGGALRGHRWADKLMADCLKLPLRGGLFGAAIDKGLHDAMFDDDSPISRASSRCADLASDYLTSDYLTFD